MTTGSHSPAFESVMEPPRRDEVSLGVQTAVCDGFVGHFEFADSSALEKMGAKKRGRLGRMMWEFRTADTLNRNRRIYPADVFKSAVEELADRVAQNHVFGNLDHPSPYDPDAGSVKLSESAVKIAEVEMTSRTDVKVVADILDNQHGRQLISVLEAGGNPGVSQRAYAVWREPTKQERERHGIPEGEFVVVAEALRLVTYDVVSEPGFSDAVGAKVSENKGASEMEIKNATDLKSKFPGVYNEVFGLGVDSVKREFDDRVAKAVEDAKPAIIEAAEKPIREQLEKAQATAEAATKAFEAIKPAMVAAGVVNEKITNEQAAAEVASLTAKNEAMAKEKEAAEARLAEAAAKIASFEAVGKRQAAMKAVVEQYRDQPHGREICQAVAERKFDSVDEALGYAKTVADLVQKVAPKKDGAPKGENGNETKTGDSLTGDPALDAFLNHQDPGAGSGGGSTTDNDPASEALLVGLGVSGGLSF